MSIVITRTLLGAAPRRPPPLTPPAHTPNPTTKKQALRRGLGWWLIGVAPLLPLKAWLFSSASADDDDAGDDAADAASPSASTTTTTEASSSLRPLRAAARPLSALSTLIALIALGT